MQYVSGPTHGLGQTRLRMCVSNLNIYDIVFLHHMPILFDIPTQCAAKLFAAPKHCRTFNASPPALFSSFLYLCEDDSETSACLNTDELVEAGAPDLHLSPC